MAQERDQPVSEQFVEVRPSIGRSIACAMTLVVVVWLVFGQTLAHGFSSWDDDFNVPGNRNLHPVSWRGVWHHWREPYGSLYVPVTYSFWALESWLATRATAGSAPAELQAWVFHAGNVLLHTINVLLVWSILRRIVRADLPALCGALLYAVHPLQVESVAWVTETKGLLSAMFGWLALRMHLLGSECGSHPRGRTLLWHVIATIAFGLALLAKPSAVVLPGMTLAIDVCFFRIHWRESLGSLAAWFALAALGMGLTTWIQSGEAVAFVPPPLWQRPFIAGDAIAFYFLKLIVPVQLAISYSRTPARVFESGIAYVTWILPLAVTAFLATLRDRRYYLGAIAIFAIGLLPVLGLVPFSYQINSTVADRYVYLSMLGPALAAAWFLARHSYKLCYATFGAMLVGSAALSAWQASYWRTDVELFRHTLEVNPQTYIVRGMLAYELWHSQPPDLEGAIEQFRESIPISHEPAKPHAALGMLFYSQERYDEALVEFDRALEIDPQLAAAHNGRGATLLARGQVGQAIESFRRCTQVDPNYGAAWFNLARVLHETGDKPGAIEMMRRGLSTTDDPDPPERAELEVWLAE